MGRKNIRSQGTNGAGQEAEMADNLEKVIRIEGIIPHTMNDIGLHDPRPPCGIYFKAIRVRTNAPLEISALVCFDDHYVLKVLRPERWREWGY